MRRSMALISLLALVVQMALVLPTLAVEQDVAGPPPIRVVREFEADATGIARPRGLAYVPGSGLFVLGDDSTGELGARLVDVDTGAAKPTIVPDLVDAVDLAVDPRTGRLVAFDGASGELLEVAVGDADPAVPPRRLAVPGGAGFAADGIAFEGDGRALYLLDGRARSILRIQRDGEGDPLTALFGPATRIPLAVPAGRLRGLAVEPVTGHVFVASANGTSLFELDNNGKLVATRDLAGVGVHRPGAMAFAPSGDRTDLADTQTLYVADAGQPGAGGAAGAVRELNLTPTVTLAVTAAVTATLVQTIYTGLQPPGGPWDPIQAGEPTSPDPSGLTYRPAHDGQLRGRIIDVDGEVDEMSNVWAGANVFELTTGGDLTRWWDTSFRSGPRITNEPTGAAWDQGRSRLYIDSDDDRRVYVMDPARGANPTEIERTDLERSFSISFSNDPEGLAYGKGELYVCDGSSEEIWVLAPGPNGYFNGLPAAGGDDILARHFDTASLGQADPEGCEYSTASGTLFMISSNSHVLLEVTPQGAVVTNVTLPLPSGAKPAGLTLAPGSLDPGQTNIYVSDRAIDNDQNGNENDGKIYEIHLSGTPPAPTPTATATATATSVATPTPSPSPSPTANPTPNGQTIQRLATSTTVNATATNQVSIATPAGTAAGDVLVACLALNGGSVSGAPVGWGLLAASTGQSNPKVYGYYHVATATEPASHAWTLASSVANGGGIARYAGVSAAAPIDGTASVAAGPAATSATVPGVTTSAPKSMVVGCVGINSSVTTVAITSPATMTQAWDIGGKRHELADELRASAGVTGQRVWTFSASRAWAAFLVALRD